MVWCPLGSGERREGGNVSAKVLLVIKMRKMQQFKNAKYARMRGMITTEKWRGEGRV